MHPAVGKLIENLTLSQQQHGGEKSGDNSPVTRLARVYEVARNALEYRADHLVRRAAIERIARRKLVFNRDTDKIAEELLTELRWALYMTELEEEHTKKEEIKGVLDKYIESIVGGKLNRDWLIGALSAEIEDKFNPNNDYQRFTTFTYNYLRQKVTLKDDPDMELVLYVAVDRTYTQSDEQQVAYHLYRLIRSQAKNENEVDLLAQAYDSYQKAMNHKLQNKLCAYVRKQMGPMVLLRDMYFASPIRFLASVENKESFIELGHETLEAQLKMTRRRMNTAMIRSLIYVFLTKMLVAFLVEVPLERLFAGHVQYFNLFLNMIIPIVGMLALTATTRLPGEKEQEKLINKAWLIVSDFAAEPAPWEVYPSQKRFSSVLSVIFYSLYGILFVGIFAVMVSLLRLIGYNVFNLAVFMFFLSVVSFFAFRIRQTAMVYTYRAKISRSTLIDSLLLPIIVVGGWFSMGVSKLNFLVFIFDFVLEAPFKIILKFLDNWFAFLSARKDDAVG